VTDNNERISHDQIPVTETHNHSWGIEYKGAVCRFEQTSEDDAVIYHLEVPEEQRNKNIGTELLRFAEEIIRRETDVEALYAQIGESNGATRHMLSEKFDYEIVGTITKDTVGEVVDAVKTLEE
jgi:GNAT superfamily N-acetyltransferase